MSVHTCGTTLPNTLGPRVEHLAACPETHDELRGSLAAVVSGLAYDVAKAKRDMAAVSRDLTPAEMAAMRDAGKTYRDIAAVSRVAPETVRRRIAKHRSGVAA